MDSSYRQKKLSNQTIALFSIANGYDLGNAIVALATTLAANLYIQGVDYRSIIQHVEQAKQQRLAKT